MTALLILFVWLLAGLCVARFFGSVVDVGNGELDEIDLDRLRHGRAL